MSDHDVNHFLYSPASSYPLPYAKLVDREGRAVHVWRHGAEQPDPDEDPPSFLRGWNHVELDDSGNLFAVVPLQAVLKLDSGSNLLWTLRVAAHHDLSIAPDGEVHVLGEEPRIVEVDGRRQAILDNTVTVAGPDGGVRRRYSLYDILHRDPATAAVLERELRRRRAVFTASGWPVNAEGVDERTVADVRALLAAGACPGDLRRALRLLRQLPGSPCDIMHTNTLELVGAHPRGLWRAGHVLVSMRSLDLVAVVDPVGRRVVWSWGTGELSGQHQPSMTPEGNILIFDNGAGVGRSRLVEVDPVERRIVWQYVADPPGSFFSAVAGGCELLPNGRILVAEAQSGRAFEVTRTGRVVSQWRTAPDPSKRRGRATIYRMSGVRDRVVERLMATTEPVQVVAS